MTLPKRVEIVEVGPREGFQYEGIGRPDRIALQDKVRLIEALSRTGLKTIQIASFVSPKRTPQMADAEAVCAAIQGRPGVRYTAIFLNDLGLIRALKAANISVGGRLFLTASETFAFNNLHRRLQQDLEMQRKMAQLLKANGIPLECGGVMAAFGCNFEGEVPLARVMDLIEKLTDLTSESGSRLKTIILADTMGWAAPDQVRRMVGEVGRRWPELRIGLHLHDTRGLGLANVYAGLLEGVDLFETAIGGLGGCPFAGHERAAGNVATEEVAFLCTVLINFAAGGPTDVEGRLFAEFIGKHIAGHPTVVVQNKEGAGGLTGQVYVGDIGPKDGTQVGFYAGAAWNAVNRPSLFKTPFTQSQFVGYRSGTTVYYARADTPPGIKKASDIVKTNGMIVGGQSVDNVKDLLHRLTLDILGIKYKYVTGYQSSSSARLALQRSEIQFYSEGSPSYFSIIAPQFVKTGIVTPLYYDPEYDGKSFKIADSVASLPISPFQELARRNSSGLPFSTSRDWAVVPQKAPWVERFPF